jgi:hypothetical protein
MANRRDKRTNNDQENQLLSNTNPTEKPEKQFLIYLWASCGTRDWLPHYPHSFCAIVKVCVMTYQFYITPSHVWLKQYSPICCVSRLDFILYSLKLNDKDD